MRDRAVSRDAQLLSSGCHQPVRSLRPLDPSSPASTKPQPPRRHRDDQLELLLQAGGGPRREQRSHGRVGDKAGAPCEVPVRNLQVALRSWCGQRDLRDRPSGLRLRLEVPWVVRRAENLGCDVLAASDHLRAPDPLAVLNAAAQLAQRMRLRTYVLNAGFGTRRCLPGPPPPPTSSPTGGSSSDSAPGTCEASTKTRACSGPAIVPASIECRPRLRLSYEAGRSGQPEP